MLLERLLKNIENIEKNPPYTLYSLCFRGLYTRVRHSITKWLEVNTMVIDIRMKDGRSCKLGQVVCAGVLQIAPDKLYVLTRKMGKSRELFVDMDKVKAFMVREPVR